MAILTQWTGGGSARNCTFNQLLDLLLLVCRPNRGALMEKTQGHRLGTLLRSGKPAALYLSVHPEITFWTPPWTVEGGDWATSTCCWWRCCGRWGCGCDRWLSVCCCWSSSCAGDCSAGCSLFSLCHRTRMNRLFRTASVLEMAFLASSLVRYWMRAASGSPLKATCKEK